MSTLPECEPPDWLDKNFLERALRSGEGNSSISVISTSICSATASGDNYLSEMYRVKVRFLIGGRQEEKSLIVKAEPTKESIIKIVIAGNLFAKETVMFRDIIPAMHKIFEKTAPGDYDKIGAKFLYKQSGTSVTAIVLEDLKASGFRMVERMLGLEMDHCLLVLKTLARYHAASLALRERDANVFNPFMESVFKEEMRSNVEGFFTSNITKLATEVETWPGYNERFAAKLHKLATNSMDIWMNAFLRDDKEFNTLSHGDLWMNNIMFRYSEKTGKVQNVRFVDFQMGYWCSPTVDLLYFLNSSPSINLIHKFDDLINEYHKALKETLQILGLERLQPTLEQLNADLQKRGEFGAVAGIAIRTIVLADRSNIPDMDKIITGGEGAFFSQSYKDAMKILLPFYEQKGWL